MTSDEFNDALVKCGFVTPAGNGLPGKGQAEFARKLELGERTVRRWSNNEWPVPTPIAMLLNLMIRTKKTAQDLKS
jgi:hypothetical protein